jgi:hypothetical protein
VRAREGGALGQPAQDNGQQRDRQQQAGRLFFWATAVSRGTVLHQLPPHPPPLRAGARSLASLVSLCPRLNELHLSHNQVGTPGAAALLGAVQPAARAAARRPLWLRIEWNLVDAAALRACVAQVGGGPPCRGRGSRAQAAGGSRQWALACVVCSCHLPHVAQLPHLMPRPDLPP